MGRLILRSSVIAGGGALSDLDVVTITGSGFGTNVAAANQEFIGYSNGPVESATDGTSWTGIARTNWTFPGTDAQLVSTNTSLNGAKSLASLNFNDTTHFQYGSKYDLGAAKKVVMFRGAFKVVDPVSGTGQVKFVRVIGGPWTSDLGISDAQAPNSYVSRAWQGIQSNINVNEAFPDVINNTLDPSMGSGNGVQWIEKVTSTSGDWYTFEFVFTCPSSNGAADGAVTWRTWNETTGALKSSGTITGVTMWNTTDSTPWRYVVLQMYIGNGFADSTTQVYCDRDFYITWADSGTTFPKYILLGDASTFAACVKKTLCQWGFSGGTWSDTSIGGVKINKGMHANLTGKYWYVMSAPGTAINSSGIAA